ncbi:MAG: ABC transporter substrate-binding protein [Thermodesulfobacteriota bacterium]
MSKWISLGIGLWLVFGLLTSSSQAVEKLNLGTAIKFTPVYYLPVLAAEEKGYWKERGLQVEWVPFRGGTDMQRAVAAGAIKVGLDTATGLIAGVARGVSVKIVSDLQATEGVAVWVLADSPMKEPKDLKGAVIGASQIGSTTHAYGRLVARALGLEKDVKFIGAGSPMAMNAALKAGKLDGIVSFVFPTAELKTRGEVRELARVIDYRPKPWAAHLIYAETGFIKRKPETVGAVVKGTLKAVNYIKENPRWSREKMKSTSRYSDETAKFIYSVFRFTSDGKINRKALENVRNFLIQYGIVSEAKTPPVEELYTRKFTR